MFRYTERKLASEIGKLARTLDPGWRSEYRSNSRIVILSHRDRPDDSQVTFYLGNLYLRLRDAPKREREAVIINNLQDAFSVDTLLLEDMVARLMLRARTPDELLVRGRISRLHSGQAPQLVLFECGRDILQELVVDNKDSVSILCNEKLEEANISIDEAYRIASANLAQMTDLEQWARIDDDVWASTYQDDYDFARLLAAGEDLRLPFSSPPMVFAPSHSVCLVTGSDDAMVLQKMLELGYERAQNHRPMSHLIWTISDGAWQEWSPASGDRRLQISGLQALREKALIYDTQSLYLEQLLESRNEDSFVAKFHIRVLDHGCKSLCTYTMNVPSYLPRTDSVALIDPWAKEGDRLIGMLPWTRFESSLGPAALQPMADEHPIRFQLMDRITKAQEHALRQWAVPPD